MLNCFLNLFMEMTFEMKVLSRPSRWKNPQNLSSLYMQSVCKMNSFFLRPNQPRGSSSVPLCTVFINSSSGDSIWQTSVEISD